MSFYDFWEICPLSFTKQSLNDVVMLHTKIPSFCLDERNPATSTEGWPNDKESDSGLPGIRGETSEKFK